MERESLWFKVSCARYGEEGKRLCFWGMKGSVWWKNSNQITSGDGLLVNFVLEGYVD